MYVDRVKKLSDRRAILSIFMNYFEETEKKSAYRKNGEKSNWHHCTFRLAYSLLTFGARRSEPSGLTVTLFPRSGGRVDVYTSALIAAIAVFDTFVFILAPGTVIKSVAPAFRQQVTTFAAAVFAVVFLWWKYNVINIAVLPIYVYTRVDRIKTIKNVKAGKATA